MVAAVAVAALESVVRLMVTDGHPEEVVVPVLMAEALVTTMLLLVITMAAAVAAVITHRANQVPKVLFLLFSNLKSDGNQTLCKNR